MENLFSSSLPLSFKAYCFGSLSLQAAVECLSAKEQELVESNTELKGEWILDCVNIQLFSNVFAVSAW